MGRHLLFTSSRDGVTEADVEAALRPLFAPDKILVSGGARGGDRIAAGLWRGWGGQVDEHPVNPAQWQRSRGAGYRRNAEMVATVKAAGDGECLAIIARCIAATCPKTEAHGTHGAVHCAGLAEAAGLPVTRSVPASQPPPAARTATQAPLWHAGMAATPDSTMAATPAGLNPPPCARMDLAGIDPDDSGLAAWWRWNAALQPGPCDWPRCPDHGIAARHAEAGS